MRQPEDIQILYAFHFDSLPNSEQETRARFLPRSLEFSKRRNQTYSLCRFTKRNGIAEN
jgi:hypothetical protein